MVKTELRPRVASGIQLSPGGGNRGDSEQPQGSQKTGVIMWDATPVTTPGTGKLGRCTALAGGIGIKEKCDGRRQAGT